MAYSASNLCIFFFFLIFQTLVLAEPQVPCFFIFGDSLVDNGNNNGLQTAAKVNYSPYGIDFPAGPTGRFTNGRNIADFIAELLGFDEPIPPFSNATNQDVLRGANYASGGAGILDDTGRATFGDVITLNEQLSNHKVTISRIEKVLGSRRSARKHLKSCIYSVGMGNNDYLGNFLPQYYASQSKYTPEQFADLLITHYSKQLRKLHLYGARKVAVFAVGKLGCVPAQLATYGVSDGSACFETSNDIARIFNEEIQILIKDLNRRLPDAKFVYATDQSDTALYGNIKVVSEPCCPTSVETNGHCVAGGIPCSNRDEYFFWDAFHPTEAATVIGAKIAYNLMSPLYSHSIAEI